MSYKSLTPPRTIRINDHKSTRGISETDISMSTGPTVHYPISSAIFKVGSLSTSGLVPQYLLAMPA